jgi:dihydrofolate reductase
MIKNCLIFAMSRNRVIGRNNDLPWHIPADLERFRTLTKGHACIMGRNTFDSIWARRGGPLPARLSVVVTRRDVPPHHLVKVANSIEDAVHIAQGHAREHDQDKIFVIGGSQIYAATLPFAHHLYATEIDQDIEGDTLMPAWNDAEWQRQLPIEHAATADQPSFRFVDYIRVQGL